MAIIDFHNHLMPAVDDGAPSPDDTRSAVRALQAAGVAGAVATPHFAASLTMDASAFAARMADLDRGWVTLESVAQEEDFQVWRGAEVALDVPAPALGDARLRLAGTRFVLVEFAYMTVPPNSAAVLGDIRAAGWIPILAHPERYGRLLRQPGLAAGWREAGAYLQVNGASLLGRYGDEPRQVAFDLLAAGRADYLCSDYHARGLPRTAEYRAAVEQSGGSDQATLLLELNPARMLQDELPLPVPPLAIRSPLWQRLRQWLR